MNISTKTRKRLTEGRKLRRDITVKRAKAKYRKTQKIVMPKKNRRYYLSKQGQLT